MKRNAGESMIKVLVSYNRRVLIYSTHSDYVK